MLPFYERPPNNCSTVGVVFSYGFFNFSWSPTPGFGLCVGFRDSGLGPCVAVGNGSGGGGLDGASRGA